MTTQPLLPKTSSKVKSPPLLPAVAKEDPAVASLSATVWSYDDPKNYLMDQMFKGINLSYQCSTTIVFNEFTQSGTPENDSQDDLEELELFRKVEAEANLCVDEVPKVSAVHRKPHLS